MTGFVQRPFTVDNGRAISAGVTMKTMGNHISHRAANPEVKLILVQLV
jgi:hypothetical protein